MNSRGLRLTHRFGLSILLSTLCIHPVHGQSYWPMFRGPQGDGISPTQRELPVRFGPNEKALWKLEVPEGHGSPVIWADRLFLNAVNPSSREVLVLAVSLKTGERLWTKAITTEKLERVHTVSNAATSTPTTDGQSVISYFGSVGLVCHGMNGSELWRYPMPTFDSQNGSGTSPILYHGMVLLNREDSVEQVLIAVDARTGKELWKFKHPNARANGMGVQSTPILWKDQVLIHRSGALSAHSLKDGSVNWFIPANTTGCSTPIVYNNRLVFNAWNNAGEPDLILPWPKFEDLVAKYDSDHDSKLSRKEFPKSLTISTRPGISKDLGGEVPFRMIWDMFDANNDGSIDAPEFAKGIENATDYLRRHKHGVTAVDLQPDGTPSEKSVLWKIERGVPEVPSPIAYDGRVYLIRNGGLLTCVDATSGQIYFDERVGAAGAYYASPVLARGKLYIASGEGKVLVIAPEKSLRILATNTLEEPIFASPAIQDDILCIRTSHHLYAFREAP